MSQVFKAVNGGAGVVDSIQGTAPIQANGVSGVAQTGNVTISIAGTIVSEWIDQAGAFTPVAGTGYFITGAATANLPIAPTQGQIFSFIVDTASILTIQAPAGKFIRVGTDLSASGGTSVNNMQGDAIELIYRASDSTFFSFTSPTGSWNTT